MTEAENTRQDSAEPEEQLAALEGTGALDILCRAYGGSDHMVTVLEDWSNEEVR
jgi:hypothetical protein